MSALTITGLYTKELFRNEKSMFTIFLLKSIDKDENTVCKGKIQKLPYNTPVTLNGNYETDKQARTTFVIESYNIKDTKTTETFNFLSALKINGFTEKKIIEVIDYFNSSIIDVIKSCDTLNRFEQRCPIISSSIAKDLYKKVKKLSSEYDLTKEILDAGGDYHNAYALTKKYGNAAVKILHKNPYKAGYYADFSFYTCEQLAIKYGISGFSDKRAEGLLLYAIKNSMNNGNSYITTDELRSFTSRFQKNKDFFTPFEAILAKAVLNDHFVIEDKRIYLKSVYQMEENIAKNITRICLAAKKIDGLDIKLIKKIEKDNHISLSTSQIEAFKAIETEGVKLITGGPGTGKTTLINSLIKYLEYKHPDIQITLCAPTGRAAQNLAGKTFHVAETVHKTLGLRPYSEKKMRVTKKMTDYVYIIDETSMLDLELADILLQALPAHAIVIFVGDKDQLPSVGVGNVFNDLLNSGIEKYVLNEVHRQDGDSSIVSNATKINNGNTDLDLSKSDFDVLYVDSEKTAVDFCLMYTEKDDSQILTPMNKKLTGSFSLSQAIQKTKKFMCAGEKTYGDITYHIGDRVILLHNNYEAGYFNGDTGVISNIYSDGLSILLDDVYDENTGVKKEVDLENGDLKDVTLSYAITIHKSQGGEYNEAVIVLTKSSSGMISRNLLYTAVTRAKKKVTIISQEGLLDMAVQTPAYARNSTLSNKIKKALNK